MARFQKVRIKLIGLIFIIITLLLLLIVPRLEEQQRQDFFVSHSRAAESVPYSPETLLVRGDWGYPPFEFLNESGEPDGFNIEIIRRIAELMNLDIRISLGPWETMRRQLEQGQIDILAGMYKTAERDKLIDFSIPHFISSYGVFVPENSEIDSIEGILDKRILVQAQDVGHDYLEENGIGAEIIPMDSWTELLPALREGQGDCAVLSMMQGVRELQNKNISSVRVIPHPLFQRRYCIAVKSGEAELLATLNEGLNMLKSTGEYDEIFERWFGVYSAPGLTPQNLLTSRWVQLFITVFLLCAVLLFIFLLWTYSLRKQVTKQTLELSKTLEKLKQANTAKSRFLASVSHELRNPLHGIIGMVRELEKTNLNASQRELLEMLSSSSFQLHRVLSDLIDVTRLENGRFSLQPTDFRLASLGTWIEPLLRRAAEEKSLQFSFTIIDPEAVLHADQERLVQIVMNLAQNALKNTARGKVTVKIEYSETNLKIEIADTGKGIPPEQHKAIFTPFTQLAAETKVINEKESGLGLGLSIVKTITALMNGTIELNSTVGQGSTFTVTLPIEPGSLPKSEAENAADSHGRSKRKTAATKALHILVAEDEAINRIYLERFLQRRGWQTIPAADGKRALKLLQEHQFDLALLDLGMPEMGGLEVARRLREYEKTESRPRTVIVALTAYADDENRRKCTEFGMDGFVSKPFKEQELVDEILRLTDERMYHRKQTAKSK